MGAVQNVPKSQPPAALDARRSRALLGGRRGAARSACETGESIPTVLRRQPRSRATTADAASCSSRRRARDGWRWTHIRECWETFERLGRIRRQDVLEPGRCSAFMVALFAQRPGRRGADRAKTVISCCRRDRACQQVTGRGRRLREVAAARSVADSPRGAFAVLTVGASILVARRLTHSSWPLEHVEPWLVAAAAIAYLASFVLPCPRLAPSLPSRRVSRPGTVPGVGRGCRGERGRSFRFVSTT